MRKKAKKKKKKHSAAAEVSLTRGNKLKAA